MPLTLLVVARDASLISYTMWKRYQTLDAPKTWTRYWDPKQATVRVMPTQISKVGE